MAQQLTHLMASLETTDDGNEDNYTQQTQIYAKNSMDRFGDDLCALLVSYFPLEYRFRYECVSKQFQRTVFGSVVDIRINYRLIQQIVNKNSKMNETIKTIATKCPNIATIDCREMNKSFDNRIPEVLNTFHDNCRHLREIYYNLRRNYFQWIPKLSPFVTRIGSVSAKHSLIQCHRLSHLSVTTLRDVFDDYSHQLMAKNLLGFEFTFRLKEDNKHMFWEFVTENQSLQSLTINAIKVKNADTITELIQQLSRLLHLRDLKLEFLEFFIPISSLNDFLLTIGVNCKQLKRLSLVLGAQITEINVQSWDQLKCFPKLKRLNLHFNSQLIYLSIPCKRLTHLSIKCSQMNSNLLDNCHELWPRLQYLLVKNQYFERFPGCVFKNS
ncbi:unnamed protein product [Medioppia subpectinata]|uniref:Uncharacterized protein n=1 Tax=Medioppia subpectinata TaxID=1979941 RepID=A0A7R9KL99_9ACAR|nr:unnamed protein product [Medioppia subpectinata]CAG2104462.1 unnamed protein product [Medioppia subpectinata]